VAENDDKRRRRRISPDTIAAKTRVMIVAVGHLSIGID
jgi:hypothetical protein